MTHAVFRLENDADDPRFYGFVFRSDASLLGRLNIYRDFFGLGSDGHVVRLAGIWRPREVIGNVLAINDFPTVGNVPAFSQRAVDALRDFLEPNGELLPLLTPPGCGRYYAYNITTVSSALDASSSDIGITGTGRHEFIADRLVGLTIFRIREHPRFAYVTDEFVERTNQHNLRGFLLLKAWPVAPGVSWYKEARNSPPRTAVETDVSGCPARPGCTVEEEVPVTSRPLAPGEEGASLDAAIAEYGGKLNFDPAQMSPDQVQKWIADSVDRIRAADMKPDERADRAFWLAIAWGESLVRRLGWEWAMLQRGNNAKTLAIVSPNRSHAVPTIEYMERLVDDRTGDATSELLYNMIAANEIPPAKSGDLRILG